LPFRAWSGSGAALREAQGRLFPGCCLDRLESRFHYRNPGSRDPSRDRYSTPTLYLFIDDNVLYRLVKGRLKISQPIRIGQHYLTRLNLVRPLSKVSSWRASAATPAIEPYLRLLKCSLAGTQSLAPDGPGSLRAMASRSDMTAIEPRAAGIHTIQPPWAHTSHCPDYARQQQGNRGLLKFTFLHEGGGTAGL
jgi:hypothetical protein